jgi:hypothetical protein
MLEMTCPLDCADGVIKLVVVIMVLLPLVKKLAAGVKINNAHNFHFSLYITANRQCMKGFSRSLFVKNPNLQ